MVVADQQATEQTPEEPAPDRTRITLDLVHELCLGGRTSGDVPQVLTDLATALGATGAGLEAVTAIGGLGGQRFRSRPETKQHDSPRWEPTAEALQQIQGSPGPVTLSSPHGNSVHALVVRDRGGAEWVAWLEAPSGHVWPPAVSAALELAALALVRATLGPTSERALERARQQSRLEGTAAISGRLAHDFGNYLTGILGFAELAATQVPQDTLAGRYLREVVGSAQQAAEWVQKLQIFSRRRVGTITPSGLAALVAEEQPRLRQRWGMSVVLHTGVPAQLPALAIDSESLRQLLRQLLDNAREAIPGQGVVTLAARRVELSEAECGELLGSAAPGPHVEVTVTDTGSGFSAEVARRVFSELFFSTKVRHRGLGLAVVYGILQTFRGGMRFAPGPEQGTAVRVYLPEAAAPPPPQSASAPREARGPRLLVVDDDPLILGYVSTALQSGGYRVEVAPGGAEALTVYGSAAEPFGLVLTDVLMPHMSGFELAQRLQKVDPNVNILFISSDSAAFARESGLGQFGLLPKPFRPEALLQAVKTALERVATPTSGGRNT